MALNCLPFKPRQSKHPLMSRLGLAALLFFCPLLPAPAWAQRGAASGGRSAGAAEINVQVRYPDGTAAPRGIHVRLESEEGGAADDCVTETAGKCRFLPNSSGMYVVRLNQVGYQEVSVHVNLVDSLRGYVTLDLKPDHPEAPSDSPDGVLQAGPQRPHGTGRAPNDPENPENPATLDACRNPRAVLRVC